ncbi:MAG: helix-turn-helix domain-containing protein [Prevotella sp.]|nr:helix-turn-helix domain-containing protein [Prevotella sp.]
MEQNEELRTAWDFVEHTGRSIFLTGKAGTGKTTFLKTVVERSSKRNIVVAPTGVAAINAGGMTIHSFFQLPFTPFVPGTKIESRFDFGKEKRKLISSLDLVIIDEISMVRSDLLDAIDSVLRRYRDRYKPFGGVQLLMIGDLQQLTPVVTPEDERMLAPYYDTPYFFGSKALSQIEYVTIQLEKVYRQQDDTFLTLLNHIREGQPTADDLALLNSRCQPAFIPKPEEGYIRLTTHNQMANHYNSSELRKLAGRAHTYQAKIEGSFPDYSYPTAEALTLKVGAQVMFVKNDPSGEHRYYNGRIGHVTYADDNRLQVYCLGDAEAIEVEPLEWENARYTLNPETREIESEVLGKFSQLPLRLAWAITIHKSQGLTFERAIIDAGLSFAAGQVYVALSRCKTLEGMVLASQIPPQAIISDERVDSYIAHQEEAAQRSIEQLPTLKDEYYRYLLMDLFDFKGILYSEEYLSRIITEFFYHAYTNTAELHKRAVEDYKQQVIAVADKWLAKIQQMTIVELRQQDFLERLKRSAAYFEQTLNTVLKKPLSLVPDVKSQNKLAMKRLTENYADLRQAWLSRRYLLQQMSERPFTIADYLRQKQQSLLDAMDGSGKRKKKKVKEPKPKKEKTWIVTYNLFRQGKTPELIARERGLALGTIYGHLARYITTGDISIDGLIPADHQQSILRAIRMAGSDANTTAIKTLCPPDITYHEVRLMLEGMK